MTRTGATRQDLPVIAVVGRREAEQRTVALRRLGGDAQQVIALDAAVAALAAEALPPDLKESNRAASEAA